MLHIDVTLIINILNLLQHVLYWNSSINSFCIHSCFVAASYIKFWVSCENHVLKLIKSQQEHTSLHVSAWSKKQDPNTLHQNEYI